MTDDRPGWGILATGHIADQFTGDLQLAGLRVAAVGSRTEDRARAFADDHGIPNAHGSWEALAADPDVDVVYVATPHPAHAAAARTVLERGKHVLVEKPFALNATQAAEVQAVARERGLIALEAMWTRWLPHVLEVRQAIAAGEIGDPLSLVATHQQLLPSDPGNRLNDPELGGGALLDLGVYPISFAHDLFGEPTDVRCAAVMGPTGVDKRVTGVLVHDEGRQTAFTTASDLPGRNRVVITGTRGFIEIEPRVYSPAGYVVFDAEGAEVRRGDPQVDGHGMQFQALEVERLMREGRTVSERMTPDGTLAVLRTMDRIRQQIGLVYPQEAAG